MSDSRPPAHYEIRVEGVLGERWTGWFEGLQVSSEAGETIISGPVADQPALHGVLVKIRDLGMCLISVRRLDPGEAGTTTRKEATDEANPRRQAPPQTRQLAANAAAARPARP
jgi:hypothetical protein